MNIQSIKILRKNLDLKRPYTIAYKTVTAVENLFVIIELENGIQGIGSTNPSKQVVGENIDDTEAQLNQDLLDRLTGRDIREFYTICKELYEWLPDFPGARAALDIALYDAFTQYLEVPLVRFLGQIHQSFYTSITIGIKNVAETLEEAEEYIARGFKILKVKLGNHVEEDIERVTKLKEQWNDEILIRVDANQGYNTSQLLRFHEKTEGLGLELIEQPMPAKDIEAMRELPFGIQRVIAADESLVSPADAFWLVTPRPACGIFNIKLMKCGGIYQGLQIAEIARHAGIALMWGCNDESIVSITAALHAALASKQSCYIDLDGSLDLAKDLVEGGFILKDGKMSVSDRPGLGVTITK